MKQSFTKRLLGCLAALLLLWPSLGSAAPFTPGNLVVVRIGDGSAALTSAATATFLLEYTPAGVLVQTIALPTTASGTNSILTNTGTSSTDALLTRSVDGRYLVLTGYDAAVGLAAVSGTTSAANNRIVGRIAADGTVDTSTRLSDGFSGGNIRSANSVDGSTFYAVGSTGGVRYAPLGNTSTSTVISAVPSNNRGVGIYGGNLYVSSSTGSGGSYYGISQVGTGLPTTSGQTTTALPGFPTTVASPAQSSYGFYFADLSASVPGVDVVYVADDRTTTDGGIQKWSLVGSTWTLNGTITGATVRGLNGSVSGTTVTLVASGSSTLYLLTDNAGYNAAPSNLTAPAALVTAVTNTNFRGSAFAPVAAASTPAPTITSFTPATGVAGTTVAFTGTNFTGTTAVTLNGTAAPGFTVNAAGTQLTVNVPVGATTGPFAITTPSGTATSASFTVNQPSAGRILLDGYRESLYGAAAALQTAATGFGNSTSGNQTSAAGGSELDAAYTRISGDSLYVFLAGNIESNGNSVDVFFDSQTGGQNVLTNTNPSVDNNGLNNAAGLTFDTGFTADYYLGLKGTATGVTAYFASLGTGGVGQNPASSGTGRVLALNLGNGRAGTLAFDQSNTGGVNDNTASAGLAGAVVTGLEFVLPLSALGTPVGSLKVAAFVNNGSHDYLSNQVLGGLPAGTGNLASASAVNFNTYAGNQYFTVAVPGLAPTITSFTPASGAAGATVTLTGTNFTGATAVTLNGVAITGYTVVNATTITFVVPAGATSGPIAVTTPGGTATSSTVFTVTASVPTITGFTPTSGPAATTVTVSGTNLTGATALTLNGVAVTSFTVVNATTIIFLVPGCATSGPIAVTTPSGTATSATSFTFTGGGTPTISTLSPARAVVGGPAFVLTIGGTNFTATTQVNFRGQTYTAATVNTAATSITVNIPASAIATIGQFTVTATNGCTASNTLDFAVVAAPTTVAFEDFERGTRNGYTDAAPVVLRSGAWTFTQALLGDLFNDRVNQARSARIRGGGSIAMNFDKPNGAGIVTISAALYGSDTGASFTAEASTDGGVTYQSIAGTPTTLTNVLTAYALTVNRTGNIRLRFASTNTAAGVSPRINLDDLNITGFTGSATAASQALPGLAVYPNPATDRLTVALPQAGAATVALRDLAGRLVLAPAALAADQQLRFPAGLAAGVYLLEVRQAGVTAVRRVEKN